MSRPALLLPIVVAKRELDGRLLLALCAAARGHPAIVGPRRALLGAPGPAIYLNHTMRVARAADAAARLGHAVIALDEEGLVRFPDAVQRSRMDPGAFQTPRLLFAWGRSNANYWRSLPEYPGTPVEITGNPRADLLRPQTRAMYATDVAQLRARHGRFVLFNTNFSFVNHFNPEFYKRPETAVADGLTRHKQALFDRFRALAPELARAIAPARLVIRPHPSEAAAPWRQAVAGLNNAVVFNDGTVPPWLIAAEAVVHNGCTTAVEARILGRPVIAYRPVSAPEYDLELPNRLSEAYARPNDVVDRIVAIMNGTAGPEPDAALLGEHVAALDGPLACERMLDAIARHAERLAPVRRKGPLKAAAAWSNRMVEHLERRLPLTIRHRYLRTLLKDFDEDTIRRRVDDLKQATGRFGNVSLRFAHGAAVFDGRGSDA